MYSCMFIGLVGLRLNWSTLAPGHVGAVRAEWTAIRPALHVSLDV